MEGPFIYVHIIMFLIVFLSRPQNTLTRAHYVMAVANNASEQTVSQTGKKWKSDWCFFYLRASYRRQRWVIKVYFANENTKAIAIMIRLRQGVVRLSRSCVPSDLYNMYATEIETGCIIYVSTRSMFHQHTFIFQVGRAFVYQNSIIISFKAHTIALWN